MTEFYKLLHKIHFPMKGTRFPVIVMVGTPGTIVRQTSPTDGLVVTIETQRGWKTAVNRLLLQPIRLSPLQQLAWEAV